MNDELIGRRVGGYEIIEVLGKGGMATVYRAHQLSMNRSVALKILPRHFLNDDTYMQRFEREVQIVSQLEHRGIVPVYDYGEDDGQPYIVMRLMAGGSIDDLLQRQPNTPLSLDRILALIDPIAPALDYAHSKGVLHRDLKPSNVLMDESGGAYLTDFGIARLAGDGQGTITTQGVVGTPAYMSPEQAQGKALDGRSDLYSLGVMLFEMATGRRPFDGDTPYGIAVHQVMTPPPHPRSINPDLLPTVEAVILRTLNKLPESRYATASAFANALHQARANGTAPLAGAMRERGAREHDTQPGISIETVSAAPYNTTYSDVTQPASASEIAQNMVPAYTSPRAYTPVPPAQSYPAAPLTPPPVLATGGTSGGYTPIPARRRRRSPNLLLNAIFGGGIGCALLLFILVITLLFIAILRQGADSALVGTIDASSTNEVTLEPVVPRLALVEPTATRDSGSLIDSLLGTPRTTPARTDTASGDLPGGQIVFAADRGDTGFDLYRLDLDAALPPTTPVPSQLTRVPGDEITPALSPDGRRIAFASDRDGDFEIYSLEVATGIWTQITDNAYTDRAPAWSPDGDWLIFSSDVRGDGAHDLRRAHADGSDPETLYSDGLRNTDPRWTSDGFFLLFTGGIAANPANWEIKRLRPDTSDRPVKLTTNSTRDWLPAFTPDGGVVYTTQGAGYAAIARLSSQGEGVIVYDSPGYDWGAFPSPDGGWIVFTSDSTGRDELYALPLAEPSSIRLLTEGGGLNAQWGASPS